MSRFNDQVLSAAVQADGKVLIGGAFTAVDGVARSRLARLNPDGRLDPTFDCGADGRVLCLVTQPDGKILIGGEFAQLGNDRLGYRHQPSLGRLNADGSYDEGFLMGTGADGGVWVILPQPDGKILLGGMFTRLGGHGNPLRNHLARLQADGSLDPDFGPGANGNVYALGIQADGKILVGGAFSGLGGGSLGDLPRQRLGRLHPDGSLDTTFDPGADQGVLDLLVQPDGKIVVGGWFQRIGGGGTGAVPRRGLARLNPDGSVDPSFNPGANATVNRLARQPDGKILVGGWFTALGGNGTTPRQRLGRLNVDGSLDGAFDPGVEAVVNAIVVQSDRKIVVGGAFVRLGWGGTGKAERPGVGRLYPDGSLDTDFVVAPDDRKASSLGVLTSSFQPDGKLVVGGGFTRLGAGPGVARRGIGRLNPDGTVDPNFNPGVNYSVWASAVQSDGRILVGGTFTLLGGGEGNTPRSHIGRLNSDGGVDTTFDPGADQNVCCFALQPDGKIVVGGYFTRLGGGGFGSGDRRYLGRLHPDGSLDTGFAPQADAPVSCLALLPDGKILAGGQFTWLGGDQRQHLGRLNADGTLDTAFDPGADSPPFALAVQSDGKILVAGGFSKLGGGGKGTASRRCLGRLNPNGSLDGSFNPGANLAVETVALQADGKILVGGVFGMIGGGGEGKNPRQRMARLNPDGSLDTTFDAGADELVSGLCIAPDGKVLAQGGYTNLTGGGTASILRNGLARLTSGSPATESLEARPEGIRWRRGGSAPELEQVSIEWSWDGTNFLAPGAATRVEGGWQLAATPPIDLSFYVRARGRPVGGTTYGSSGLLESVSQLFLSSSGLGSEIPFIQNVTLRRLRNDWTGVVGMQLLTGVQSPSKPITVTAVGRMKLTGNSRAHRMRLLRSDDRMELTDGTVSVDMADGVVGQFTYVTLAQPVDLPAAGFYHLTSEETAGGDCWADEDTLVSTTRIGESHGLRHREGEGWFLGSLGTVCGPVGFKYYETPQITVVATDSRAGEPGSGEGTGTFTFYRTGFTAAALTVRFMLNGSTNGVRLTPSDREVVFAPGAATASVTVNVLDDARWQLSQKVIVTLLDAAGYYPGVGSTAWVDLFNDDLTNSPQTSYVKSWSLSTQRKDWSGFVGMKFVVGPHPIAVRSVGRLAVGGETRSHWVKLVRASDGADVPGGGALVRTNTAVVDFFQYASLPEGVILQPETAYYLVSEETAGGDTWYNCDTTVNTSAVAAQAGAVFGTGPGDWNMYSFAGPGHSFGPVSFRYDDLPVVSVVATDASAGEPGSGEGAGTLLFRRDGPTTDALVVKYILGGATNRVDPMTLSGSIVFAPGAVTATVAVRVINDMLEQGPESLRVDLSSGLGYHLGGASSAVVAIADDDGWTGSRAAYVTRWTLSTQRSDWSGFVGMKFVVGEHPIAIHSLGRLAVGGGSRSHRLKLVRASDGQDVPGGGTLLPADAEVMGFFQYADLPERVVLQPGAAYYLVSEEQAGGDAWYNCDTTVATSPVASEAGAVYGTGPGDWNMYSFAGPGHAFGPLNFLYEDRPVVTVAASDPVAGEPRAGEGTGAFTFYRSGPTTNALPVRYRLTGATNRIDASALAGTITFDAGSATATLVVSVRDDAIVQTNAPLVATLIEDGRYFVGKPDSATVSLRDDDSIPEGMPYVTRWTLSTQRNDWGGYVGMKFVVGDRPILIRGLGRLAVGSGTQPHLVKLVRADTGGDVQGGAVLVRPDAPVDDFFQYGALASPLVLEAGSAYYLVSLETAGGDAWYNCDSTVATSGAAVQAGAVYGTGQGDWNTYSFAGPGHTFGPLNFKYEEIPTVTVTAIDPVAGEPATGEGDGLLLFHRAGSTTSALAVSFAVSGPTYRVDLAALSNQVTFAAGSATVTVPVRPYNNTLEEWPGALTIRLVSGPGYYLGKPSSAVVTLLDDDRWEGPQAVYVTNWALSTQRNDWSGFVGMKFVVGDRPILIRALGRLAVGAGNRPHRLKLVWANTGDDVPGAQAVLAADAPVENFFQYTNLLANVYLTAGTAYYLVSEEIAGGDPWYNCDTTVTTSSVATQAGAVYGTGPGDWHMYSFAGPGHTFGPLNFKYADLSLVSVVASDPVAGEPGTGQGTGTFVFSRAGNSSEDLTVGVAFDGTASPEDYVCVGAALGTNVFIPAGVTSVTVTVVPQDDALNEPDETVRVRVLGSRWCQVGEPSTATVSLLDDDAPQELAFITHAGTGVPRNDWSGYVGMELAVGTNPVTVTALGRMKLEGNARTHTVKLVNGADGLDVPSGAVSLSLTAGVAGEFQYAPLTSPIVLPPGGHYYLVSQETEGGDAWYGGDLSVSGTEVATVIAAINGRGPGSWYPYGGRGQSLGLVNFKYLQEPRALGRQVVASPSSTPAISGEIAAAENVWVSLLLEPEGGKSGSVLATLTGPRNVRLVLEVSTDLKSWLPVPVEVRADCVLRLPESLRQSATSRFYRLAPAAAAAGR